MSDILKLGSEFTVQQMIKRDMFQKRIKEEADISVSEFLYPIMVGYDSVMLDVDCELGGSDQLFNMLAGRTLQQRNGKREKFVLTVKLIEGTDGRKMSKTYDNCIWLEDSAKDMYGKIMSIEDKLITLYMECCTDIPMDEIIIIEKKMIQEENPMQFKKQLAEEIVRLYHGDSAALEAAKGFSNVFAKGELPEDIPEVQAKKGESLLDLLLRAQMITSKSDGRRLIEQKGIHLGDVVISDNNAPATEGTYKVGKRKFVKVF
jgi:tyrosyl-tRNA synthetase